MIGAAGFMAAPKNEASKVTTKDGLLWRDGKIIPLPEADWVAEEHGYVYAEQLVRALEAQQKVKS